MKKVLIGIVIAIIIAITATGWFLRADVISFVNVKFGSEDSELIQSVLNVENNSSLSSFMDVQKATLEKKDYKNFSRRTSEEVTLLLKDIAKRLPGFDDLSNILFIEDGDSKRIDVINLNVYNKLLKQSYTAFVWESMPTTENPTWNGYFRRNENILDIIDEELLKDDKKVEETVEEADVEITLEEFMQFKEYTEAVSYKGVSVIPEEDIMSAISATFGKNFDKIQKLYTTSKESVLLDEKTSVMLGANDYGIGYGGKIDGDNYCVVVGSLTKDNVIGTNNYLLFKITTNGNYTDYSTTLKTLAKLSGGKVNVEESIDIDQSLEETQSDTEPAETAESTTVANQTTAQEETTTAPAGETAASQTTSTKKNPTDLFEELLKEQEEESSTKDE